MIKGIGIDIIELKRIEKSMEQQPRFPYRILTEKELIYFKSLSNTRRCVEFLAGRFAAKEAFAKATGRGIGELSFQHMEVLTERSGAPTMNVIGYEEKCIHLSISHSEEYAIAQVILEQV